MESLPTGQEVSDGFMDAGAEVLSSIVWFFSYPFASQEVVRPTLDPEATTVTTDMV